MKKRMLGIVVFSVLFGSLRAQQEPAGLAVGSVAPVFEAVQPDGTKWVLKQELAKGPVVLIFYRGNWCPYCNKYLNQLQDSLPAFEKRGAKLVAITPETTEGIEKTMEKTTAAFPILHDSALSVMKQYDVAFSMEEKQIKQYQKYGLDMNQVNGENGTNLPVPAVYIIDSNGRIVFRHFDRDYTKRAKISDLLSSLDQLRQ